jgi:hypothetical protein
MAEHPLRKPRLSRMEMQGTRSVAGRRAKNTRRLAICRRPAMCLPIASRGWWYDSSRGWGAPAICGSAAQVASRKSRTPCNGCLSIDRLSSCKPWNKALVQQSRSWALCHSPLHWMEPGEAQRSATQSVGSRIPSPQLWFASRWRAMGIARHFVSDSPAPLSLIMVGDVCLRKTMTWLSFSLCASRWLRGHVSRDACTSLLLGLVCFLVAIFGGPLHWERLRCVE